MPRIAIEERRAALLAAAIRVIARDGITRASTRAIAAEAGMPTASFHYVFASHSAMLEELVATALAEQQRAVVELMGDTADLREFALAALHGWLERALVRTEDEIALHDLVTWSRTVPDHPDLARSIYRSYLGSVETFVRTATERFGVRWRLPEGDVAAFALVLTDGVSARWLVDRDDAAARRSLTIGADALLALADPA